LVISFEPHETDIMRRRPRPADHSIVDGFVLWRVIFVGLALWALTTTFFFWSKSRDASDELARTVAVNALVIGQIAYLLNSRYKFDSSLSLGAHRDNPYLPLGIGAVAVLQLVYTYAPPFESLFHTQPVPLRIWPWLLFGGVVFFLIVEAEKVILRKRASSRAARGFLVASMPSP
jgi:magnesium-transporting ATPase (P-type)